MIGERRRLTPVEKHDLGVKGGCRANEGTRFVSSLVARGLLDPVTILGRVGDVPATWVPIVVPNKARAWVRARMPK